MVGRAEPVEHGHEDGVGFDRRRARAGEGLGALADRAGAGSGATGADVIASSVTIKEGGKEKFSIVRDNLNEVVVWNPWEAGAKATADFWPQEGYKQMICVEAGAVKGWVKLDGGESWEGGQIITSS